MTIFITFASIFFTLAVLAVGMPPGKLFWVITPCLLYCIVCCYLAMLSS